MPHKHGFKKLTEKRYPQFLYQQANIYYHNMSNTTKNLSEDNHLIGNKTILPSPLSYVIFSIVPDILIYNYSFALQYLSSLCQNVNFKTTFFFFPVVVNSVLTKGYHKGSWGIHRTKIQITNNHMMALCKNWETAN